MRVENDASVAIVSKCIGEQWCASRTVDCGCSAAVIGALVEFGLREVYQWPLIRIVHPCMQQVLYCNGVVDQFAVIEPCAYVD